MTFYIGIENRFCKSVNPNDVVENRTDIEAEFNEPFLESDELNTLW